MSTRLRASLSRAYALDVMRFGGEADHQRAGAADARRHRPGCRAYAPVRARARRCRGLLELVRPLARRVVGHGGGADVDVGRQRGQHRGAHLRGRAHVDASHARRRGNCTGPATRTTSAPRRAAAAAIAKPILPLLRLPTNRTGSMSSYVGPALTTIRTPRNAGVKQPAPQRGDDLVGSRIVPARIRRRPAGRRPDRSPARRAGAASRLGLRRRVAHMRWFIAGAIAIGAVVARHSVLTRSSASPCASFASVLAVAGAITTCSAQRASSMCPIAASAASSQSVLRTVRPETAWKLGAPTKCSASAVIATCTSAPASRRRRTSSTALYAAMPPQTHSRMRRCCIGEASAAAMVSEFSYLWCGL